MTTFLQARKEVIDLIRDAWLANGTSSGVALVFENAKGSAPPTGQDANGRALPWARISVRNLAGEEETLGPIGAKRFLYSGLASLEIYTAIGDGMQVGDALAQVGVESMRGNSTASGVWFYQVGSSEVGLDGKHYRQDVVGRFRFEDR